MAWLPGQKLYGERYIIQRPLGKGGFGVTYLAKNDRGSLVVIKTIKDEIFKDPNYALFLDEYLRNFREEALRLALCRHPHIVQIENAFYENSLPCMVMEYISGQDFWEAVKQQGVFLEAEAVSYIRQIGEALSAIHEKGLLHRDVKPRNIILRTSLSPLLSGNSEAVLIDFGLAREFIPNVTLTHTAAGSNGFAPIEQYAERGRWGEFTDVYALAGTLYYLLTGQVPIPAPARAAKIALNAPQQFNANISDRTQEAILKGMEFHAEDRPQSVQEWLKLLEDSSQKSVNFITNESPIITKFIPDIQLNSKETGIPLEKPLNFINPKEGIDYTKLRNFLLAKKWKEANQETLVVMLKASSRKQTDWLRPEDIQKISSLELRTIDNLWVKYSQGHFGFSVQKRILQNIEGTKNADRESDPEIWRHFSEAVGWRENGSWLDRDRLMFQLSAKPGHLPALPNRRWGGCNYHLVSRRDFVEGDPAAGSNNIKQEFIDVDYSGLYEQSKTMLNFKVETQNDNLNSELGIDYKRLRDLLALGQWQEADRETAEKMYQGMGREAEGWLRVEDMDNFPSTDLQTIDRLWLKYSNNRFGFSLQKRIYESLGGSRIYNRNIWQIFSNRVGWRENNQWLNYNQLTFSTDANIAHLPAREAFGMGARRVLNEVWAVGALLSRSDLGTTDDLSLVLPKVQLTNSVDMLSSERGVDYGRLRDLLAAGNWREADVETRAILLKVCDREREGSLTTEAIEQLPCLDLHTLDRLWVKYSNGRFGISVQQRIWESFGGNIKADAQIWYPFAEHLGWRVQTSWLPLDNLSFSLDAPEGQLPVVSLRKSLWGYLFARAASCQL